MIIRVTIKNLYSFKEETEFNMLPNKSQHLPHHKITRNEITFLRLGALYGANGAGKTNLIKVMGLLVHMIRQGRIIEQAKELKFKLSHDNEEMPSSVAVEFWAQGKIYYYTLTFNETGILYEALAESCSNKDINIFERSYEENKENITFKDGYADDPKNKMFVEVLSDKLIHRNDLLLSFLNKNYAEEFTDAKVVYEWFTSTLVILRAGEREHPVAQMLDSDPMLLNFADRLISRFDTGISSISVEKKELKAEDDVLSKLSDGLKRRPNGVFVFGNENIITSDEINIVNEDNKIIAKRVLSGHKNDESKTVAFQFGLESDGTKRLVDYLPAIYNIVNEGHVYLIDEIERSIHPVIIKEIISKISADEAVKGQLIFTTHESCLLDQNILRPDEIWFAQKNSVGSTQLYSLSDFNIHHTANIENGYLNGRYGAIPFVSNLCDLHWNNE